MSTQTTYRFEPGASRGWLKHFELSWRALRRAPSFAVPAVVTIALGIGAATAVFSLVYAILIRPFPYPDADRLVRVFTVAEGEQGAERNCSLLDIEEYNRRSTLLENIGGYTVFDSQIEGDGLAEAVVIAQLNQEAMHAVGVQPVLGRLFTEEEDRTGGPVNKAILGHGLWQRRYGGAPDALGRMIRLPMGEFEVVGVMPAGYGYPDRATLWLTMESWYALGLDTYREKQRDQRWYPTVARLAPGVSLEQAQDEMGAVARQLAAEFPTTNRDVGVRLVPLRDAEVGEVRPYLALLAGGVSLVLLICIFNVANLLLARALTQHKQYVVQAALGAGRFELTKGFLAESLLLAAVGGAGGAAVAWVAVRAFQTLL
ncbi:MAG: FtsX-like permease family protein, partial [Acidobacteria bacterium]|nr:FtsX-like permease family protein [Acidobacteriota bacterium]